MAAVLRSDATAGELARYASRQERGSARFAKALCAHFALVAAAAGDRQRRAGAAVGPARKQGELRRESVGVPGSALPRWSPARGPCDAHVEGLGTISPTMSSDADAARRRPRRSRPNGCSAHIDVVASSIEGIAQTPSSSAEDAEKTSALAAAARVVVDAAKDDAKALTKPPVPSSRLLPSLKTSPVRPLCWRSTPPSRRRGPARWAAGFGVVAHEVKQLATRTSQATEDVRSGLRGITAASQRIAERVAKLVQSIDQVAAVAKAIAGQMREQDANSQAITSTTAHTAADVRNVASTVKDVAGMIGQTSRPPI